MKFLIIILGIYYSFMANANEVGGDKFDVSLKYFWDSPQQLCAKVCSNMSWKNKEFSSSSDGVMTCQASIPTKYNPNTSYPVEIGYYEGTNVANKKCQDKISEVRSDGNYQFINKKTILLCGCLSPSFASCKVAKDAGAVSQCVTGSDGVSEFGLTAKAETWNNQQTLAKAYQGDLVTIKNADENMLVNSMKDSVDVWIGQNDRENTHDWIWVSGSESEYSNWKPGEPNNLGGEHCGILYHKKRPSYAGMWNDVSCGGKFLAVIEWR